jgi:recombination protein RecA
MIDPSKKQEKLKIVDTTIQAIEKQFGKGSVFQGYTYSSVPILCSTGSIALDIAIGSFGIPEGRIIEIYGPESSGKTTASLIMMAKVQQAWGITAFVDAEHALDPTWAEKLGVNMNEVLVSQPECGEEALEIVEHHVRSRAVDYIIVDSVAALVPKAEIDGDMGDSHMGLQARLMSQAMRKLTAITAKSKCVIVFINQIRSKIGITWGSPEVTTGGNALKFYASVRMEVRKEDLEKNDDEGQTSIGMKVKIVKNKIATPFKIAHLPLLTGKEIKGVKLYGFDNYAEVLNLAVDYKLIKKAGAWFSYGEERWQGKDNVIMFLRENQLIFEELKTKVSEEAVKLNRSEVGSFDDIQDKIEEKAIKKNRRKSKKDESEAEEINIESETNENEE